MNDLIKIGTRGSQLAIWQAEFVASKLKKNGFRVKIVVINTKGDRILNKSISEIGSKGVFTQELENALKKMKINIAVHSAKDVQSALDEDFHLLAFTKREIVNDVIVSFNKDLTWNNLIKGNYILGTSSVRRRSFVKFYFSNCCLTDIRGNLQTRIEKLKEGRCDGIILAFAGVKRMGLENLITQQLSTDFFIPPPGQGALAIECLSSSFNKDFYQNLRKILNHTETQLCVEAERMFFFQFGGGCSMPVFCFGRILNKNNLELTGGIIDIDGKIIVRETVLDIKTNHLKLAKSLVDRVNFRGGGEILKSIKKNII